MFTVEYFDGQKILAASLADADSEIYSRWPEAVYSDSDGVSQTPNHSEIHNRGKILVFACDMDAEGCDECLTSAVIRICP